MPLKYDVARSELLDFVPAATRRLLDVGCGVGRYAAGVRERHPGIELWAIEPDPENVAAASANFDYMVQGRFPEMAAEVPQGQFDVITFNDVLEHLVEPSQAIDAAQALLAPGGRIIASIPNVRHRSVIWPLVRHGAWDYEDNGLLDRTHLRWFTRRTMCELFERQGWIVESVVGINRCWDWRDNGGERLLLSRMRRVVGSRLDDFFFVQYVVTACPRSER